VWPGFFITISEIVSSLTIMEQINVMSLNYTQQHRTTSNLQKTYKTVVSESQCVSVICMAPNTVGPIHPFQ